MTIWVLRQEFTPEEEAHIFERTDLFLPFGNLPDLTHVTTPQEARQLLKVLYPNDPPEAITRRLDRFWEKFTSLQLDDLVVVPLPALKQVVLAEISGPYHYRVGDDGGDVHMIPVRWYSKRIPMRKFAKHKEIFSEINPPLSEVTIAEIRVFIREHLPHGYNRFAKFKWLLAVFFAMGLLRMFIR